MKLYVVYDTSDIYLPVVGVFDRLDRAIEVAKRLKCTIRVHVVNVLDSGQNIDYR